MNIPVLFQLDFEGDDAKLKTVVEESIKEVNKKAHKGILKTSGVKRYLLDGKTLIEVGVLVKGERFNDVRAVFGKIWRKTALRHDALPQKAIEIMRKEGEI
jgi:hypothetical protein